MPVADFKVKGNMLSIMLILTNLIKNSLYYIAKANKGTISISIILTDCSISGAAKQKIEEAGGTVVVS